MVLIRLESVRNRLCNRLFPLTRSANIKALNAPSQPPRLFKCGKRKNRANKAALAGHNKARYSIGLVAIPIKQQTKTVKTMTK